MANELTYQSVFTGQEMDERFTAVAQLTAALEALTTVVAQKYVKPASGIPSTDMDADVQAALAKANTAVQSLADYYTKSEVDQLLAAINGMDYVDVATLPTASASTLGKIYLVGPDASGYYAYYYTSYNGSAYSWVGPLGTTQISLANYATKAELSQLDQEVGYLSGHLDYESSSASGWKNYGKTHIKAGDKITATISFSAFTGDKKYFAFGSSATNDSLTYVALNAGETTAQITYTASADTDVYINTYGNLSNIIISVNIWGKTIEGLNSSLNAISTKLNELYGDLWGASGQSVSLGTHRNGVINLSVTTGWENRSLVGHYMIPVIGGCGYKVITNASGYKYVFLKEEPTYSNGGIRPETYPVLASEQYNVISLAVGATGINAPYDAKYLYLQVTEGLSDPALSFDKPIVAQVYGLIPKGGIQYSGEQIKLKRNAFTNTMYGVILNASHQGGAVYGDTLFLCKSDGTGIVYDLADKTLLGTFNLGVALHCNAVFFGEKYSSGDDFPVLYVNSYLDNVQKGTIYGFRITESGGVYTCTLVQTINVGFVTSSIWTDGAGDTRTYGNFVLDKDLGVLYAYTLLDTTNVTRFFAFPMPEPTAGNVTFAESDILSRFDVPYLSIIQDSCFAGGRIFIESGDGTTLDGLISVVDPVMQAIVSQINLNKIGITFEPECIDVYKDSILYGSSTFYEARF